MYPLMPLVHTFGLVYMHVTVLHLGARSIFVVWLIVVVPFKTDRGRLSVPGNCCAALHSLHKVKLYKIYYVLAYRNLLILRHIP